MAFECQAVGGTRMQQCLKLQATDVPSNNIESCKSSHVCTVSFQKAATEAPCGLCLWCSDLAGDVDTDLPRVQMVTGQCTPDKSFARLCWCIKQCSARPIMLQNMHACSVHGFTAFCIKPEPEYKLKGHVAALCMRHSV